MPTPGREDICSTASFSNLDLKPLIDEVSSESAIKTLKSKMKMRVLDVGKTPRFLVSKENLCAVMTHLDLKIWRHECFETVASFEDDVKMASWCSSASILTLTEAGTSKSTLYLVDTSEKEICDVWELSWLEQFSVLYTDDSKIRVKANTSSSNNFIIININSEIIDQRML